MPLEMKGIIGWAKLQLIIFSNRLNSGPNRVPNFHPDEIEIRVFPEVIPSYKNNIAWKYIFYITVNHRCVAH